MNFAQDFQVVVTVLSDEVVFYYPLSVLKKKQYHEYL
jgi:hypothetical protein